MNTTTGIFFRLDVLNEQKNPVVVATNMMGTTPVQLAAELKTTCDLNPNVQRPCSHMILSLPDRNGYREDLDDKQYAAISKRYLQEMGFVGSFVEMDFQKLQIPRFLSTPFTGLAL